MAVRRRIHLRLCAGALLLTLPIAATSTNAVGASAASPGGAPVADRAVATSALGALPFGFVATAAVQPSTVDTATVARRVKAAGDRRLQGASPTPPTALAGVGLDELDIPRPALVAYQVAATTMRRADADCGIDWTLLAAIGRVETDHGRHTGSRLGADGVSTPLIRGVALNGKGPVAAVRDTDAGRLDGDTRWDRAVGPMQFLPSTWDYTGVDANGDGVRSPDDINDAALGAAVYLCAAPGRLDRAAGLRAAVLRYNPSSAYVDLVARLAKAYGDGELAEVQTGGTTLALGAIQTGPSGDGGAGTTPSGGSTGQVGTTNGGDGTRGDGGGTGNNGDQDDAPGKGDGGPGGTKNGGNDGGGGNGKGGADDEGSTDDEGRGSAQVREPKAGSGVDTGGEPPESGPEKDPPEDPEPILIEVTGVLTLVEDVLSEDGLTTSDQWNLTVTTADGAIEELPLDVGDETWLATTALADLDADEVLETNLDELTGLLEAESVVLMVEDGTEPALVHTVNGSPYLPAE